MQYNKIDRSHSVFKWGDPKMRKGLLFAKRTFILRKGLLLWLKLFIRLMFDI